jgi:transposase
LEAVRLYESSDKSMSAVEQELGSTRSLLSKWVQQACRDREQAFPGKGQVPEQEAEMRRLQREVEVLKQEREILKKAVLIFSDLKR